ncbi:MAG: GNAT family N-acetyltransferase [Oscillospiraceae bacterium]|nr:GNAT family N-acetyltransferase [Oscillospiraceae bacterium]
MIEIRDNGACRVEEVLPLYAAVGWTNYTDRPDMLSTALDASLLTLGAYDGGQLVGLLRAVGDGASILLVQDLLVLPDYQRRGIGTRLMRTAMERFAEVYQFQLMTDDTPRTVAFYRSLGLIPAEELGCRAFVRG